MKQIATRVIERVLKAEFGVAVRGVLDTPPVAQGTRDFTALSMVHHRDVLPYLLAIKSFARYASPRRIAMVADPTITREDEAILRAHLPMLELTPASALRRDGLPIGGTWERLIGISERVSEHQEYVVQLDADTVTIGPIPEVCAAIDARRSFVLATANDQHIGPCSETVAQARPEAKEPCHIQLLAEANLDALNGLGNFRYVRGCSGFAGFASYGFGVATLHTISRALASRVGNRWSEWGTEQVTSNIVTSSDPNAILLPHPKYSAPHWSDASTAFLHFIGYVRFRNRRYVTEAKRVIGALSQRAA